MREMVSPYVYESGADQTFRAGGAMSRDSCKYIAQLPQGLAKGMGAGPAPRGGHSLEEN